ncbi:MAG: DUF4153 domain-containing protein [Acidimicrobiales bacterium]
MTDTAVRPPDVPRSFDAAPRQLIGVAIAAGLAFDVGLRGGVANAAVVAGVVLVVVALVVGGRVPQRGARVIASAAIVPAVFLGLRASPWLAVSNAVAIVGLLLAAITYAHAGSVFDATPRRVLKRGGRAIGRGLADLPGLRHALPAVRPSTAGWVAAVSKAALITLPVLAIVVALLASGDAVFAHLLLPDVNLGPIPGHVALTLVIGLVVVCAVLAASAGGPDTTAPGRFGATEVVTMLVLTTAVLGLFVVSQLVALTDAGRRVIESAGLTPAEYARSGFFQLCWATALLLALLGFVRAVAAAEVIGRRSVRALGAAVPFLATGLVVVSLKRMALYDRAYGLTMLRLWVIGAAVWMGIVLVMVALRNAGYRRTRDWVLAAAVAAGLALVLMADVTNPEAFVARHNIARARDGAELDAEYLAELSDDAVGAIVDAGATLPCRAGRDGVAALNLSVARAAGTRRALCPKRPSDQSR